MEKQGDNRRSIARVFDGKNKLLEKCFGMTSECYVDVSKVQLTFSPCRAQGYDGAAVMSGKYSGLHKKIQNVAPHAYYVHCASNSLNLVLKDAMEAVTETRQFYDTIESVYDFFWT